MISIFAAILFMTFVPGAQSASEGGDLIVEVTGIKGQEGQVGVLVFKNKSGYPSEFKKAFQSVLQPIAGPVTQVRVPGLAYGEYVVTVMHDENGNAEFDTGMFSMPKEGYGISNDPPSKALGPPNFDDGKFAFAEHEQLLRITVRYP